MKKQGRGEPAASFQPASSQPARMSFEEIASKSLLYSSSNSGDASRATQTLSNGNNQAFSSPAAISATDIPGKSAPSFDLVRDNNASRDAILGGLGSPSQQVNSFLSVYADTSRFRPGRNSFEIVQPESRAAPSEPIQRGTLDGDKALDAVLASMNSIDLGSVLEAAHPSMEVALAKQEVRTKSKVLVGVFQCLMWEMACLSAVSMPF